jgi:hypothetical protein
MVLERRVFAIAKREMIRGRASLFFSLSTRRICMILNFPLCEFRPGEENILAVFFFYIPLVFMPNVNKDNLQLPGVGCWRAGRND